MDYLELALKIIISGSILNVWLLRFGKPSQWRGGQAKNMKEEFAVYGLPTWFMNVIGGLKVILALLLLVSIWSPQLEAVAAYGIAVLMLGAVSMHIKVGDPLAKSIPAFSFLVLSLLVALL
jgi:uncharacterized membrane protein YkgB